MTQDEALVLAHHFSTFLETCNVPRGLFTPDVFCDFTLPKWRLQAAGIDDVVGLRKPGLPGPGEIPRRRCDATENRLVLEFEERWAQDGKDWYRAGRHAGRGHFDALRILQRRRIPAIFRLLETAPERGQRSGLQTRGRCGNQSHWVPADVPRRGMRGSGESIAWFRTGA